MRKQRKIVTVGDAVEQIKKSCKRAVVCLTNEKPFIMRAFRYTHGTCKWIDIEIEEKLWQI